MRTLITNIKSIIQVEEGTTDRIKHRAGKAMQELPGIYEDAWMIIEDKKIYSFGKMSELDNNTHTDNTIDAEGGMVLPAWCDSHTHLVYAASREQEFTDRIKGLSYEEIAQKGGGILNSANKMKDIDENLLFDISLSRLEEAVSLGTGSIEIKSGYGLSTESELKMLRVIRRLKEQNIIPIKATFLAAHSYPLTYRNNHQGYINLIINEMLPRVADEGLAEYMDVFCEQGFFSVEETAMLLEAGLKYGLKPKIHANQLYKSGGVQVGVQYNAVSVDHLESMGQEEVECLQNSKTIPTLLPGAAFFLAMHYQPARLLIDGGLPVALASDYNPGTCPCLNMNTILTLACTQLKMTPEEAINAQTINAAAALELNNELGTIAVGKMANIIITKPIPSVAYLPYKFGSNLINKVIV